MVMSVPNMGSTMREAPVCELGMVSMVSCVFLAVQIAIIIAQAPANGEGRADATRSCGDILLG